MPPSARIAFPTGAGYTGADTIAVRGYANDAHGVVDVTVNGVSANSLDHFQTWRADVPLATGVNTISVTVTDAAGNVANGAATAIITNKGEPIYSLRGIDFDPTGNQLIVGDRSLNVIYSVSLDEGVTRAVSPAPASPFFGLTDLTVDAPRNRAIVVESYLDALVAVDLATGVRTVVAPGSQSTADTRFTDSASIAVDTANNRAFVTRPGSLLVIGVDLDTGVRTVVTSTTVGAGDPLGGAAGIVYDNISNPGTPRLLVSEGGSGAPDRIVAVDIATGDRTCAVFIHRQRGHRRIHRYAGRVEDRRRQQSTAGARRGRRPDRRSRSHDRQSQSLLRRHRAALDRFDARHGVRPDRVTRAGGEVRRHHHQHR